MGQRVAVASSDGVNIDLHFARAFSFYIYDINEDGFEYIENRRQGAANKHDEDVFAGTLRLIEDCRSIIVGRIGMGALSFVNKRGFRVFEAPYPVSEVLQRFVEKNILREG